MAAEMFNDIFCHIDDETSREVQIFKHEREDFYRLFNCTERLKDVMQYSKPRSIRQDMTKHIVTQYSRRRALNAADVQAMRTWCKEKLNGQGPGVYQTHIIGGDDNIPDHIQNIVNVLQTNEIPKIYKLQSKHTMPPIIVMYKKGFNGNFCREPNFLKDHISICVDVLLERPGKTSEGLPIIDNTLWNVSEGCSVQKTGKDFGSVVAVENDEFALYLRFTYLVSYEDYFCLALKERSFDDRSYHDYIKELATESERARTKL